MSSSGDSFAESGTDPASKDAPGSLARALLLRTVMFAILWVVLVRGSLYNLPLSVLTIAAAAGTSLYLVPAGAWRLRPLALVRFVPFFLYQSVRGGIDVAWRALHPALPIDPGYLDLPMRLTNPTARTFLAVCLSLFPGTVSTDLQGDRVRIHVLDRRLPVEQALRRLEAHVAAIFGDEQAQGL